MPIRVRCRSCTKELRLKDSAAGKTIKCPDCDDPVRVPRAKSVGEEWDDDYDKEEYDEPRPRRRASTKKSSGSGGRKKRKKSAKKSNQTPLIIGGAIGGVVIIGVVVAVLMSGDGDANVSTDGGGGADSTDATPNATTSQDASNTQTRDGAVSPTKTAGEPESGPADDSDQIAEFDDDAWSKASAQLKASGIGAFLMDTSDIKKLGTGLKHIALIDLPLPRFEEMPDDLWARIKPVSHIYVRTEHINGLQMQKLAEHPGLIGVNINRSYVGSGDGLIQLQKRPQFRSLLLSVPMGPVSERLIGELTQLRSLGLNHDSVSNETLASITNLTELRSLSLQGASVNDDGVAHIVKLTKLETLFLDKSRVTDLGLNSLQNLKSLTLCSVRDLAVSPQAVAALQAALPDCRIFK